MLKVVPVFRVFNYEKVIEFYVDFLGFEVVFKHQPGNFPFYMQVKFQDALLDLSEHHGDATPGGRIFITGMKDLASFQQQLMAKEYRYLKPGLHKAFWDENILLVEVLDPFMNKIIFQETLTPQS
ncbi:hypothetical protein LX64_01245 [Chitinophaga skermanii]|uniref:Bleomycin resistance protein n=1 Tax=Chitinophaga skermanii TaxID=331697 RepID=A0A327QYA5_9BACT|nr:glyoxalase superfamily protein [Chitinophaga skermanii]RAJ08592.1 hypothetical protein LX64_01245 [Chitinophaga skermanii]